MATIPLIPAIPTTHIESPDEEDVTDEDFSDEEEDLAPKFDLNIFGDSSESDEDEDGDDNGEEEELPPITTGELAKMMNLGKPTTAFPMATQNFPVNTVTLNQPIQPVQTPIVPNVPKPIVPTTQPKVPGLQLNILPTTPIPKATIPQVNIPFPGNVKPTVPTVPTVPGIPQLTGFKITTPTPTPTPTPTIPGIPQLTGLGQTTQAPQQKIGLTLTPNPIQPTITNLPAQPPPKNIDIAAILAKMPGISVMTITPAPATIPADINDLIQKEADETPEDFEARRRLTLKLASIPDYKLNNTTAVIAGLIMMKKAKLGLTYDPDIEAAIAYLTALLQR
jgi:hypothetical protein